MLKKDKRVSVSQLAKKLYVSDMTIRRDLSLMEKSGYLQRYHGGAINIEREEHLPINQRKLLHSREKSLMAKMARPFLRDSISVYIDSSSTCMYIIPIIAEYKDIRIITNSIQNLLYASQYHIPCTLAGGNYYEQDMCNIGSITEQFFNDINVDLAFFSVQGISEDGIISDYDEKQTAVRKNAKQKVFLFGSAKQNKKYLYTLCNAREADEIIFFNENV